MRPDVMPHVVKCKMYTPPHIFLKFAREWMNFNGTADDITAEMKAELLKRSFKLNSTRKKCIQKDSDAFCDPRDVYEHIVAKPVQGPGDSNSTQAQNSNSTRQ